jgi:hypothetical protein
MVHPRVLEWHNNMECEMMSDQMYVDDESEAMDRDESREAYWTWGLLFFFKKNTFIVIVGWPIVDSTNGIIW